MIEVAEKSILWLKFKTLGKQTHGSTPQKGINSFKAASFLITELQKLYRFYDLKIDYSVQAFPLLNQPRKNLMSPISILFQAKTFSTWTAGFYPATRLKKLKRPSGKWLIPLKKSLRSK